MFTVAYTVFYSYHKHLNKCHENNAKNNTNKLIPSKRKVNPSLNSDNQNQNNK